MTPTIRPRHSDGTMTTRTPRRARRATCLMLLALTVLLGPSPAIAAEDDPSLSQKLDDLPIVHGRHVLDSGHVDMGPKFDGKKWRVLVHDDAARADADAESVWRYPAETVFRVVDEGRLNVPDDPAYAFIGKAGKTVWVVPQTQNPDVVWLGWNTQDPEVMKRLDRGVTMSLTGVQGPGDVVVYLQSGSFGAPQLLWDSRKSKDQPIYVEVNTHTHANWAFTKPGVYLLRLKIEADLRDGSHVSGTQLLRFAVGSKTSTDEAFAAKWSGPAEADGDKTSSTAESNGNLVPLLIGAIALAAVVIIAVFGVAIARSSRARKQVLAARARLSIDDADRRVDS